MKLKTWFIISVVVMYAVGIFTGVKIEKALCRGVERKEAYKEPESSYSHLPVLDYDNLGIKEEYNFYDLKQ